MNKHILILGIAVLLLTFGLSGCDQIGSSALSPKEVREHPNQYLGKRITVEGYYTMGAKSATKSFQSEEEAVETLTNLLPIENNNKTVSLFEGEKYRFTRVLKENTALYPMVYLDVEKIEPV